MCRRKEQEKENRETNRAPKEKVTRHQLANKEYTLQFCPAGLSWGASQDHLRSILYNQEDRLPGHLLASSVSKCDKRS